MANKLSPKELKDVLDFLESYANAEKLVPNHTRFVFSNNNLGIRIFVVRGDSNLSLFATKMGTLGFTVNMTDTENLSCTILFVSSGEVENLNMIALKALQKSWKFVADIKIKSEAEVNILREYLLKRYSVKSVIDKNSSVATLKIFSKETQIKDFLVSFGFIVTEAEGNFLIFPNYHENTKALRKLKIVLPEDFPFTKFKGYYGDIFWNGYPKGFFPPNPLEDKKHFAIVNIDMNLNPLEIEELQKDLIAKKFFFFCNEFNNMIFIPSIQLNVDAVNAIYATTASQVTLKDSAKIVTKTKSNEKPLIEFFKKYEKLDFWETVSLFFSEVLKLPSYAANNDLPGYKIEGRGTSAVRVKIMRHKHLDQTQLSVISLVKEKQLFPTDWGCDYSEPTNSFLFRPVIKTTVVVEKVKNNGGLQLPDIEDISSDGGEVLHIQPATTLHELFLGMVMNDSEYREKLLFKSLTIEDVFKKFSLPELLEIVSSESLSAIMKEKGLKTSISEFSPEEIFGEVFKSESVKALLRDKVESNLKSLGVQLVDNFSLDRYLMLERLVSLIVPKIPILENLKGMDEIIQQVGSLKEGVKVPVVVNAADVL